VPRALRQPLVHRADQQREQRVEDLPGRGVDLVLEMVGGETFRKNLDAARPFGRIVVYGSASAEKAAANLLERVRHALLSCPVFGGIPEGGLDEVLRRVQLRSGSAGAILLAQDEPGDALFIVVQGRVKVVLGGDNGREVTLAVLRPGEVFGEVALLDGSPRSANVVAMTDAVVAALNRDAFLELLRSWPRVGLNLMSEMARRLRRADEAIVGLALHDVEERLSRILARLAREEGDISVDGGLLLRRRPTQQELANMVGSSRETISRTFTSMIRRGLMVPKGRTLVLTQQMLYGPKAAPAPSAATAA